jgi:Tfp pilus assembly protein PilF/predicted aspartyl protease
MGYFRAISFRMKSWMLVVCMGAVTWCQNLPDAAKPSAPAAAPAAGNTEPLVSAQALLKKHKFIDAAAAFRALIEKDPSSTDAQTGLVRSLLRAHKVDEAEEAGKKALVAVPSSAAVHAAVGDVAFRSGRFGDAEAEYRAALKLDSNSARGTFGMARMMDMVSMRKSAAAAFAKAHELDPEDEQIFEEWAESLPRAELANSLKKRAGEYPTQEAANRLKFASAIAEKKPWVLSGGARPTEIKMPPIGKELMGVYDINRSAPMNVSTGFGLQVKFNDRASADLLLDTGASGITIGTKLADKAGAVKIADTRIYGLGDQGAVASYAAWIDKITIGSMEFHNCVVIVSSKNEVGEESGLIGPDVFEKFLITLDFRERKLLLAPLPKRPGDSDDDENPQDRYIAPELQSFTRFYRFGHHVVVPVVVSDKTVGNFILDTGAFANNISTRLASQVTKASADNDYLIKGVSGKVESVLTGKKVILQFARMRIESHDLPVMSMDGISSQEGTEIAGFIGIRTLVQMKMTLDYRDGLVNLEVYDFKKARE